jgi:hypothetical protein
MARANKRLPSSVSVSKSAIDSATSTLQGLPEKPKENWSLREAVSVLQESISAALSKGYSYEEVASMLSKKGVDISASSLKSYLSAAKRQKGITSTTKRRGGRRPKSEGNVSLNGASTHTPTLTNTKAALSALSEPDVSTVIADTEVELPAKKPTRRKSKAESAPTAQKTAAKAKPSSSAVSKTKATPKTPSSRMRKKSS